MKSILTVLSVVLVCLACNTQEDSEVLPTSLYGQWKLNASYGSNAGGSPQWKTVVDGYTYTFYKDHSFTSNRFSACTTGTFEFTETQLSLSYNCEGFTAGIEQPQGTFVEQYTLDQGQLILTPTYLQCDEGCAYKFVRN